MDEYIFAIFCPPTGVFDDLQNTNRLTDDVFLKLKECKINRIFGYGYDCRWETIFKTFELCDKYDIYFLPTLPSFEKYYGRKKNNGRKLFEELNEKELDELDKEFVEEISRCKKYKSFKGVFFQDECGYLSFDGIGHAKRVFDKFFKGYEFHTNTYSYTINEDLFWETNGDGGKKTGPFELKGDLEITFDNRFNYYDLFVSEYLKRAKQEFMSFDKYPFDGYWIGREPEYEMSVHIGFFELTDYYNYIKKKYGFKFYNYMQVGQWFSNKKKETFPEFSLQMHVNAAYGSEGFAFFPGCFPLDWIKSSEFEFARDKNCSLIDLNGETTIYYEWTKKLNTFFSSVSHILLNSSLIGVYIYGEYDNGFKKEELEKMYQGEALFKGDTPRYLKKEHDELQVKCSNSLQISKFNYEGKTIYYLVNLSTVYKNTFEISFLKKDYLAVKLDEKFEFIGDLSFTLDSGDGMLIIEK